MFDEIVLLFQECVQDVVETMKKTFKKCSACTSVQYCSRPCQVRCLDDSYLLGFVTANMNLKECRKWDRKVEWPVGLYSRILRLVCAQALEGFSPIHSFGVDGNKISYDRLTLHDDQVEHVYVRSPFCSHFSLAFHNYWLNVM